MKHLVLMAMTLTLAGTLPACMTDAPEPGDEQGEAAAARTDELATAPGVEPSLAQAAEGEELALYCEGEFECPTTGQIWIFTCGARNAGPAYTACNLACPVTCIRY